MAVGTPSMEAALTGLGAARCPWRASGVILTAQTLPDAADAGRLHATTPPQTNLLDEAGAVVVIPLTRHLAHRLQFIGYSASPATKTADVRGWLMRPVITADNQYELLGRHAFDLTASCTTATNLAAGTVLTGPATGSWLDGISVTANSLPTGAYRVTETIGAPATLEFESEGESFLVLAFNIGTWDGLRVIHAGF